MIDTRFETNIDLRGEIENYRQVALIKYYKILLELDPRRDRLTILDALSMAGDLTIYGNRSKVMVLRQEGDVQRVYGLNLTSGEHIYSSPAYYLQQNDVVYVEPNEVKARQSTVNGNNVRSTSFWISLASLLTSVAILIFN